MELIKPKRLYFDIETSPMITYTWRIGFKINLDYDNIIEDAKIICISWKWEGDDEVHNIAWDKNRNDKEVVKKFVEILDEADEIVAHNGDRFDMKWVRSRAILHGIEMRPFYTTTDTLKLARHYFRFPSNRLDDLGQHLGVGRKQKHEGFQMWKDVYAGDEGALRAMVAYCDQDVKLLEKVFKKLQAYVQPRTHHNYLRDASSSAYTCPECGTSHVHQNKERTTATKVWKWEMVCKNDDCGVKHYTIGKRAHYAYLADKKGEDAVEQEKLRLGDKEVDKAASGLDHQAEGAE